MYPRISLGSAAFLYLGAICIWLFAAFIANLIAPGALLAQAVVLLLAWAACGYGLNRLVLHPLIEDDHSVLATLHSQSSIKMACFLWWPIKYPELILRVFFVRHV